MSDRTVAVRLRAEIADFKAKMSEAAKATKKVGEEGKNSGEEMSGGLSGALGWIDKNEQHLSALTTQLGLVGAGLTGLAALAVKKFADFDEALSHVAATGEDARTNIVALRDAAIDAGAATQYSATEAANGIEELAKAGLTAQQILSGGLTGSLNLAAAGTISVSEAAGYTAIALSQFGLGGSKASHVADLLAAGAGKAQGEVGDLGMALKQSGLVANQTGLTIEETTGALSAFAQAGLLGSDAGTSLKTMLQRLNPTTEEAQAQFTALGVSAYDSQGNFVGLADFAGQLKDSMSGLTPQARNAALAVMFGSDAVRAATVLYDQGSSGIQTWIDKVNDSGYAAKVAAEKTNNLKGDLERFTGSLDTALIQSGSGANAVLRQIVQAAEAVVDGIGKIPGPVLATMTILVGTAGLVALGVAGLGKLALAAGQFEISLVKAGIATEATAAKMTAMGATGTKALGKVLGVVALIAAASSAVPTGVTDSVNEMDAAIGRLANGASAADTVFQSFGKGDWFNGTPEDLKTLLGNLEDFDSSKVRRGAGAVDDLFNGLVNFVTFGKVDSRSLFTKQKDALAAYGTQLGSLASTDLPSATKAFKSLYDQAGGFGAGEQLLKSMPGLRDSLVGIANDAGLATDDATLLSIALGEIVPTSDAVTAAAQAQADASTAAADALAKWEEAVAAADASFVSLGGAYDAAITKNQEIAQSTADATKSSKDSWTDYYDGVSVSADEYIAQLQAQVNAQSGWETNILTISARVRDGMTGDMRTAGEQMIDELMNLGPEGAAQVELLKNMTDEQFAQVVALWSQKGTDAVTQFTTQVESYRQPVITPTVDLGPAFTNFTRITSGWSTKVVVGVSSRAAIDAAAGLGRAAGGPVVGPGTGTSDSILAKLSTGEHVWTAREVVGAGGHAAVERIRAYAKTGSLPAFAAGGRVPGGVGSWSSPAISTQASPRTYSINVASRTEVTGSDMVRALRAAEALEPAW